MQPSKSKNQHCYKHHCPIHRTHSNQLCRQCAFSLLVQDVLQESVLHSVLMCLQFPPVFEFSVVLKGMNLTFCWMTLNPDLPRFLNSRLRSSFLGGRTTEMMLCSISVPYQEARGGDPSHPGGEALWEYINILFLVKPPWMTPAGSTTSVTVAKWGFSIPIIPSTLISWLSIVRKSCSPSPVYLYQQELMDSYFIIHF